MEEAKQNAEDQEALHQAYQDKIDVLDQQIEEAYARFPNWMRKSTTFNLRSATGRLN